MYFKDRKDAAEQLVKTLIHYKGARPLVLGIPRGSVPMAELIADRLDGELDVILVHKIGAPSNPEFAIGSASEFGNIYRSYGADYYGMTSEDLQRLAQSEIARLTMRRQKYSPLRPPINPENRTVIIVDDGIATGATMLAAVRSMKQQKARRIIVAAPVAAPDSIGLLQGEADDIVVLDTPSDFYSISQFYRDFPQVSDADVETALTEAALKTTRLRQKSA